MRDGKRERREVGRKKRWLSGVWALATMIGRARREERESRWERDDERSAGERERELIRVRV